MKNIIIFGGGFDPIHNGHMNMAINASKALNAEVFFVPARIAVWKSESIASPEQKIEMVELAIKEAGKEDVFHISDYEIKSNKETNYSIETVKYFKSLYPNDNLFLLIGTDQVNSFEKWKEAEEIAKLATIIFFPRPGYELNQENIDHFKMKQIEGDLIEENSSSIRELKSLRIPRSVADYIIDKELYFMPKIKSYMGEKRYRHSISVAKLAADIAVCNKKEDWWRYLRAGLLHDIAKEMPIMEQKVLMAELYPEYVGVPRQIHHQFLGEYLAKRDFGLEDAEEIEAIKYHTTGKANMSAVAKVIYASDKIEPTRGFDSSELINSIKVNIDYGFISVLSANREYFIEHNIEYDNPLTKECMEFYLGK
ncbi:MAG: nicotinate (nicotinamide) nucleotide adenylyltransferase [Bacilli bacterium]|nr:nicotinate (nicotinamide) nucleotide adenylyltransferase [Bacilli bacterium]